MLQQLRQNMKVLWIILICFPFGFVYLLSGRHAGGTDEGQRRANAVAVIDGRELSYEQYNRIVNQLVEQERRRLQRDELASTDYERIEDQAWDELVSSDLLGEEARRLGIQVPDAEIVGILSSNPPSFVRERFTDDKGEFDVAAYQRAVNDPNYPWGPYEELLRRYLPTFKLQQMVRAQASVSEDEVRREFARRTQRTKVRCVAMPFASIELPGFAPSDADLRKFHADHPEFFLRGETVVLEVARVDKKPSPSDEEDVQTELQQVRDQLGRGENFAAMAEVNSDDPSGERGGDIGWVAPGRLPTPVMAAAAKLEPGQTSDLVRVDESFYIVHVDSARTGPGGERELRLREIVARVKTSSETLDSLRSRVIEAGQEAKKDFAAAARKLGVPVQRLEPAEHTGIIPSVGYSKRLSDWAFQAKPGDVSEPLGTQTAILLARLVEKRPKSPLPFEQARDQVRYALEQDQKKQKAQARLAGVEARLALGAALATAAEAEGLQVQDPAPFTFYDGIPGIGGANEFSAVAAALAPGQRSGVVVTSTGACLLEVLSRDPFDDKAYQAQRQSLYGGLLSQRESAAYQAWYDALLQHAEIKDLRGPRV